MKKQNILSGTNLMKKSLLIVAIFFLSNHLSSGQISPPILQWNFASVSSLNPLPNTSADWFYQIVQTHDGNFIAAGYTQFDTNSGSGGTIPVIVCLDPNGNRLWEQQYYPTYWQAKSPNNMPQPEGNGVILVSAFFDIHEIQDGSNYYYVALGQYGDGGTIIDCYQPNCANNYNGEYYSVPIQPGCSGSNVGGPYSAFKQNVYAFAVEIDENGNLIKDASNNQFGYKEFWANMLVWNQLHFPTCSREYSVALNSMTLSFVKVENEQPFRRFILLVQVRVVLLLLTLQT